MSQTGTKVVRAAGLLMLTMVVSRLLGYVRDIVIYTQFGQGSLTDAYNAAFSIPDFLYMLLVGGALSSAFIPVFSGYLATGKAEEGWRAASIIFNTIMVLLLTGIGIGLIFTPQLVHLLVPKLSAEAIDLTIKLTRIMFAQTFFMAMNGIAMGILNSHKHFTSPAVGSVLYNLMIIVVGWTLSLRWGIMGFSIGVVAGAIVNFAVQIPALVRFGLRYEFSFDLTHPGVRKIMHLMLPVLIGLSVTQFNLFVSQNLASGLAEGMISALRTAQRLMQVPIGVFGIAVAVAVFPTLSEQSARQEIADFKRTVSLGVRTVIFLTLPAAVGLIVLRVPIVQALFEQGKFDRFDTLATAEALLYYALGLFAYSAIQVLNRVFYSIQDTKTPVAVGVVTILLNIGLNFTLIDYLGHGGLALAYSLAGIFNLLTLLFLFRYRMGKIGARLLLTSFLKTLFASVVMGAAAYLTVDFLQGILIFPEKLNQLITVTGGIITGVLVFGGLTLWMRMEEAQMALSILRRRFAKKRRAEV
jgi:putative peptidoglycan lipid II flippase